MTTPQPDEPPVQPPDPADPLAMARFLGGALTALAGELKNAKEASEDRDNALTRYGKANRHRIWLTYSLLAVDIALTIVVAIFAGQAHAAASAASQTRQASAASCASGNQLRGTLTQVFDHVFGSFGPGTGTRAQKAAAAAKLKALEAYYHGQFAPRNCTAIYGVTPAASAAPAAKKTVPTAKRSN